MKNHLIQLVLFVSALVLTVSCVQEVKDGRESFNNEISFIVGSPNTRADMTKAPVTGARVPLEITTDNGQLSLVETVEVLDFAPVTKGTPAFNENVGRLYGSFDSHVLGTSTIPDAVYTFNEDSEEWSHQYDSNPWEQSSPISFWMNMPVAADLTNVDGLACEDGENITFTYQSPATAEDQQDILFTSRTISKEQYYAGGNHLTFFHALTGVKFAIGNKSNDTRITRIEFTGLYDSGSCTVTPDYASGITSADCVEWTGRAKTAGFVFSQDFNGDLVTYDPADAAFGESFYAAGTEDNINDEDASLSFWFIPQTLSSAVKLTVTFEVGGAEYTQTVDFGDKLKKGDGTYPNWEAGQLRTYTLTSNEVDINIDDTVDDGVKSDVVITNTGNVDCYIRAAIVGFWTDGKGKIVESWMLSENNTYNVGFNGLPGSNWVRGDSNYFYYTEVVKPGLQPGQESASDDVDLLFNSYSEPDAPSTYPTARLRMSVMVQAISASEGADYQDAWSSVAGVTFPSAE